MTVYLDEYERYLDQYKQMHESDENVFVGKSTFKHNKEIREIITKTNSTLLLDYGCGKGRQYTVHKLHENWGVAQPVLYDPAYEPFSKAPEGINFHGVICTDVLEHIPEEALDEVLGDIFSYANRFVFLNVSTRPAGRLLPNGENAHCTVKPHKWWKELIAPFFYEHKKKLGGFIVHLESTGKKNEREVTVFE